MPFEDVAFPRSANNLEDYFDPITLVKPKCPIHVRAALVYNKLLETKHLDKKYQKIRSKDKIKFAYLKDNNPLGHNVIGIGTELPEEFRVTEYIDRELQFEKAFLSPIRSITDIIGWTTEPMASEERFYVN